MNELSNLLLGHDLANEIKLAVFKSEITNNNILPTQNSFLVIRILAGLTYYLHYVSRKSW